MDRKMEDELPKMQVGFIDAICLPLYQVMNDFTTLCHAWNRVFQQYQIGKNEIRNLKTIMEYLGIINVEIMMLYFRFNHELRLYEENYFLSSYP